MADFQVAERLAQVREKITAACAAAGRPEGSVRLVAVSKRIALPLVLEACQAGQWDLGENRVQDALERQISLANLLITSGLDPQAVRWHFIGHLQRNKAGKAADRFALIHGVDSVVAAERLSRRCVSDDCCQSILLAVNISGEAQKHGQAPAAVSEAAARIAELPGVSLQGVMGMGARDATPAELSESFALLRRLCEDARVSTGLALPEISMGMSRDYELAIAEGATTVRVGSAIFGPRQA
jgi:pyridoxal phosphate enzyme (YggS family)